MPTDEAIDLVATLPDGSRYVAATEPLRAWSEARTLAADVRDDVMWLTWALALDREQVPYPPRVDRPADVAARRADERRRMRARAVLEGAPREEV